MLQVAKVLPLTDNTCCSGLKFKIGCERVGTAISVIAGNLDLQSEIFELNKPGGDTGLAIALGGIISSSKAEGVFESDMYQLGCALCNRIIIREFRDMKTDVVSSLLQAIRYRLNMSFTVILDTKGSGHEDDG